MTLYQELLIFFMTVSAFLAIALVCYRVKIRELEDRDKRRVSRYVDLFREYEKLKIAYSKFDHTMRERDPKTGRFVK